MDTFISDLAKTYIGKLQNEDEEKLEFVEFKMDTDQRDTIGMHSDGVGGEIIYKTDGNHNKSQRVFVKFVSTKDQAHKHRPFVVSMFDEEIHFYIKWLPFLNSLRNIEHLIPPFLDYKRETQQGDTIAIMFRHLGPQWVCNNFESFLDYPHLSLLMRKIGEFHAYSFAAKSKNESEFHNLSSSGNNNVDVAIELFGARIKQTLERSLQALRHDQRYTRAIPRLENRIQNYGDFMKETYESSPDQYYVLGHRGFNQSNVLFTYEDNIPVDMKIMDWQSASFVSLGIDLVSTLYPDASQQTRDEHWDRLLDDYHDSLRTTFPDNIVPSKDQVLEELRKSVGAAIFLVTYRVNNFHLKTESKDKSKTLWNDEFVTEMLKDMINRGLL